MPVVPSSARGRTRGSGVANGNSSVDIDAEREDSPAVTSKADDDENNDDATADAAPDAALFFVCFFAVAAAATGAAATGAAATDAAAASGAAASSSVSIMTPSSDQRTLRRCSAPFPLPVDLCVSCCSAADLPLGLRFTGAFFGFADFAFALDAFAAAFVLPDIRFAFAFAFSFCFADGDFFAAAAAANDEK
jgi:hypothetical protein